MVNGGWAAEKKVYIRGDSLPKDVPPHAEASVLPEENPQLGPAYTQRRGKLHM